MSEDNEDQIMETNGEDQVVVPQKAAVPPPRKKVVAPRKSSPVGQQQQQQKKKQQQQSNVNPPVKQSSSKAVEHDPKTKVSTKQQPSTKTDGDNNNHDVDTEEDFTMIDIPQKQSPPPVVTTTPIVPPSDIIKKKKSVNSIQIIKTDPRITKEDLDSKDIVEETTQYLKVTSSTQLDTPDQNLSTTVPIQNDIIEDYNGTEYMYHGYTTDKWNKIYSSLEQSKNSSIHTDVNPDRVTTIIQDDDSSLNYNCPSSCVSTTTKQDEYYNDYSPLKNNRYNLNVFTCVNHHTKTPLQPATVIVAEDEANAREVLDAELVNCSLLPFDQSKYQLDHVNPNYSKAYILSLGVNSEKGYSSSTSSKNRMNSDADGYNENTYEGQIHSTHMQSTVEDEEDTSSSYADYYSLSPSLTVNSEKQKRTVYLCTNHYSMFPVPAVSLIVATSKQQATKLLDKALKERGAKTSEIHPYTLQELELVKKAYIISTGQVEDYTK